MLLTSKLFYLESSEKPKIGLSELTGVSDKAIYRVGFSLDNAPRVGKNNYNKAITSIILHSFSGCAVPIATDLLPPPVVLVVLSLLPTMIVILVTKQKNPFNLAETNSLSMAV